MVAAVFKENVEKVIRFPDIRFEVSLFLTLCKPSYIIHWSPSIDISVLVYLTYLSGNFSQEYVVLVCYIIFRAKVDCSNNVCQSQCGIMS